MAEECPFVSRYVAHYLTLATVDDDRTRAWSASQHWLGLLHGMSNIVRMCPWFISPRAVCRAVYLNDLVSLPLCSVTLVQKYYTECLNTSCDIVSLVNKERSRPERKRRSHLVSSAGLLIWVFRLLSRSLRSIDWQSSLLDNELKYRST